MPLTIVFLFLSSKLSAQIDSAYVPSIDSLKNSLRVYYLNKADAEIQEFRYATKFRWLNFVPNLGYDAFRQSPVLTTNLSGISQGINSRYANRAKIASIQKVNEVLYNEDLIYIRSQLQDLKEKIKAYNRQLELLQLREMKFRITETGYKRKEVAPSEYLNAQLEIKGFKVLLENSNAELLQLRNEILTRARVTTWENLYQKK